VVNVVAETVSVVPKEAIKRKKNSQTGGLCGSPEMEEARVGLTSKWVSLERRNILNISKTVHMYHTC